MRLIDWTNMALMEFYKAIAIDAQPYDSHEIKKNKQALFMILERTLNTGLQIFSAVCTFNWYLFICKVHMLDRKTL